MLIKNNDVVLFQGDSVTDCGRDVNDINSLGFGYAMMAQSWFYALHPDKNVRFINKGIGGNRVIDLKNRWDEDCIQLMPTVVSILIGINDCWRRYDSNDPTSVQQFEDYYRGIMKQVKNKTNARIILCEPFVLPCPDDRKGWREDLDPKIHVVRKLAIEFKTMLIPLDGIFNSVAVHKGPEFWTADGVHPTFAGHALIAKEWLKSMECF